MVLLEKVSRKKEKIVGNVLMVTYALSIVIGVAVFLREHKSFLRFADWMILSLGTLMGTTCVTVVAYYWLRMTGGGGGTIRLFVGFYVACFGWIVPFLIFSYVFGHAARRKAIGEEKRLFFRVLTSITLAALAAPVLNFVFMIIASFTTIPLLYVARPFLKPLEHILFR